MMPFNCVKGTIVVGDICITVLKKFIRYSLFAIKWIADSITGGHALAVFICAAILSVSKSKWVCHVIHPS